VILPCGVVSGLKIRVWEFGGLVFRTKQRPDSSAIQAEFCPVNGILKEFSGQGLCGLE
jgi:hypothetical protein